MSQFAMIALVRDGHTKYFVDRWAAGFLFREMLWGPDDFETWVSHLEPSDEWEVAGSGAIVDFDQRRLIWTDEHESLVVPRVWSVYERLLDAAWPDFEVRHTDEISELFTALGLPFERFDDEEEEYETRSETVLIAGRIYDDEDDEELGDEELADEDVEEDDYGFDEEESRAWVTVISNDGVIRHRQLDDLPLDLLRADQSALERLETLAPAEVPPEAVVSEGMWIRHDQQQVGIWGRAPTKRQLAKLQDHWTGWTIQWSDDGYTAQCGVSGPTGVPMNEQQALAKFLPIVLSTKRFDMDTVFGAIGGSLRKTALKGVGCLFIAVCTPLLLFGLFSGNWTAVLISVLVTAIIFFVGFKIVEYRFKKKFKDTVPKHEESKAPPVAGPLDENERRARLDELLKNAGFPSLDVIEPQFAKDEFGLLG